jgi:hypothetical protein
MHCGKKEIGLILDKFSVPRSLFVGGPKELLVLQCIIHVHYILDKLYTSDMESSRRNFGPS